ncbi:hypothetical protein Zmor_004040 [Zophobas morio]|uniref:Uncharacterized protein n=1 Tax=Zophobas morio TaxID=2755281 RepID=A0AA38M0F7_9CUCU|nr:hypothetical protein Zmor_004040 [Zophobas morio]
MWSLSFKSVVSRKDTLMLMDGEWASIYFHFAIAELKINKIILSTTSSTARTVLAIVTYVMYRMPRMTLNALFTEGDSKSSVARLGILTVCIVNHGHHT